MDKRIVNAHDVIGTPSDHYEQALNQRGGRIAHGFFRIRQGLGDFMHLRITSLKEQAREKVITYHEERKEPKGIAWPEDFLTEDKLEEERLIGSGV